MFTSYDLPIDTFLPARTRSRRLTALAVAVASAVALAIGSAGTASAAVSLSVGAPAFSPAGGAHVEASAYGTSYGPSTLVESTLYQYYGAAWHVVDSQTAVVTNGSTAAKAWVRCTGALTGYSFYSRARAWNWTGSGWSALPSTRSSAVVVRPC